VIILGIFANHDAGAALFEEYNLLSAVALERMTRIKCDGGRFPSEAVDECLAAAGLSRADVDVIALPLQEFPAHYFSGFAWWDMPSLRRRDQRAILRQMVFQNASSPDAFFDTKRYAQDHGFRPATQVAWYNHHFAHGLGALFHTDWEDAVLYTADGGGDRIFYSVRELSSGVLHERFGTQGDATKFWRAQHAPSIPGAAVSRRDGSARLHAAAA
jgi:carbamoyltransferase